MAGKINERLCFELRMHSTCWNSAYGLSKTPQGVGFRGDLQFAGNSRQLFVMRTPFCMHHVVHHVWYMIQRTQYPS
jgi:hypothetical protein